MFGSRLYQQLKDEPGNIIMSPFSVSGVMAMVRLIVVMAGYGKFDHQHGWLQVAAGAGGETLSQVQQGMSFPR